MRDLGNTLIVVEHDEDTMREADYLIDVGPGAGVFGGEIVAAGTPKQRVSRWVNSLLLLAFLAQGSPPWSTVF